MGGGIRRLPGATPGDTRRIRSLARMARALGAGMALRETLETAAEEARDALGAASVSVSTIEPGRGRIRTVLNVGDLAPWERRWPPDEVYPLDDFREASQLVHEMRAWATHLGAPDAQPEELELLRSLGKWAALGAPVLVDGAFWGELYATRAPGRPPFGEADLAYSDALTAILGGAVSRALHVARLEELAFRDPLTGLANRRAVDDALAEVLAGGAGEHLTCLVVVDVNGLKRVNDDRGHDAGDQVLVAVASLLQRHFSSLPGALVARIGGDEFAVVAPGHAVPRVMGAARTCCSGAVDLPHGAGLSFGVACSRRGGTDAHRLFHAADQAQYTAKRTGRSTVVLADGVWSG